MAKPRMATSGAQYKILLYLDEHGNPSRPLCNAPSTHILKPDIISNDIAIFALSVKETMTMPMLAAARCGLGTARGGRISQQPAHAWSNAMTASASRTAP